MERTIIITLVVLMNIFCITGCGQANGTKIPPAAASEYSVSGENITEEKTNDIQDTGVMEEKEATKMNISVNDHMLKATLADTQAAKELASLLKKGSIMLTLNEYGSFEKVGELPQSLTKSDEQITSQPGDIMLYQGSQMTIFYGSNTWSYTRLGKIENISEKELAEIFGSGDITVTLSLDQEFDVDAIS